MHSIYNGVEDVCNNAIGKQTENVDVSYLQRHASG